MAKEQVLKVVYDPPFELEAHILGPTGEVVVPWRVPPCWAELLYLLFVRAPEWACLRVEETGVWEAVAIAQPE